MSIQQRKYKIVSEENKQLLLNEKKVGGDPILLARRLETKQRTAYNIESLKLTLFFILLRFNVYLFCLFQFCQFYVPFCQFDGKMV
ncbi:hypothetical protein A3Q56_04768 [Intoshia linei]|uniref:Uncharacterized protein n=1 Tax=Intoshia linei TaxID=1819745 RepID=A0A177AZP1_9BILA|nr:hypothetical protein A3Q56_04768 [Intoshia linei]